MFTGNAYFPLRIRPDFVDNFVEIVKNSAVLGLSSPSKSRFLWIIPVNIQRGFG